MCVAFYELEGYNPYDNEL